MTHYIMVEDRLLYIMYGVLCILGMYMVISMIVARSYIWTAWISKVKNRPLGFQVDKVGRLRYLPLVNDENSVKTKKSGGRWGLSDNSGIRFPQGINGFMITNTVKYTLRAGVISAITTLENLGHKSLSLAESYYLENLTRVATNSGYFMKETGEVDGDGKKIMTEIIDPEEFGIRYSQMVQEGEKILDGGGIPGDRFTLNLSSIHRWVKTESNPLFTDVIVDREVTKEKKKLVAGLTLQKLAGFAVVSVIVFLGAAIAYSIIQSGTPPQIPVVPTISGPTPVP